MIQMTTDFSSKTMQAKRQWNDIFKIIKQKNRQQNSMRNEKLFQKQK